METISISTHPPEPRSWANVASSNLEPPEGITSGFKKIIYKKANLYKPISILEMVSSIKPEAKKLICMGGTPFKLGCRLNEFKVDIDIIIEEILCQIDEIQSCFEVDAKKKIPVFKI
ncbi:hypothetical protein AYI70_g10300 [Smittium culicis]|uniref:Uncharacterized protein n=1 Tax=Smittium culicis TaxID=133412 RepID=A0A1R1X769_9FUNG|nr:hypothetical protein AYI70_g10300 [Smittium culicis]